MGTNGERHVIENESQVRQRGLIGRWVAVVAALAVTLALGTPETPGWVRETGVAVAEASGGRDVASRQAATQSAPTAAHGGGKAQPDSIADFAGGIAARVYSGDGDSIPGDLFLLMAVPGSDADARLFNRTPYGLDSDRTHPEALESNRLAVRTIEGITGTAPQMVDFTSAPGGGSSAGITYAIAYLNIMSDGAFTGDLVVAATGRLRAHGYVSPIDSVDAKIAAAHLAGAEVLFTPSIPAAEAIDVHGARVVGELFRARNTGSTLSSERQWNHYESWGASRPGGDIDVVGVRHIGDVAAYLCGAGSEFACDITDLLENVVTNTTEAAPEADSVGHRSANTHPPDKSTNTRRSIS